MKMASKLLRYQKSRTPRSKTLLTLPPVSALAFSLSVALVGCVGAEPTTKLSEKSAKDQISATSADILKLATANPAPEPAVRWERKDRKSTRLNSSHVKISYAVFCLKKKKKQNKTSPYLTMIISVGDIT